MKLKLNLLRSTVPVPHLSRPLRILHVTNIHLCECDARNRKQQKFLAWFNERQGGNALAYFDLMLKEAKALKPDFIAFTGDFGISLTAANWDVLASRLARLRIPYGLTFGNHDWDWPELATPERRPAYRRLLWKRFVAKLSRNPEFEHFTMGGVHLVFLDNSDYQVSSRQLSRMDGILRRGEPVIPFFHIPVSVPTLRPATLERWFDPILCGDSDWEPLRRRRWEVAPQDTPATRNFCDRVMKHSAIAAAFTGHLQIDHIDRMSNGAQQFVTPALHQGHARLIELHPA